MAKAAPEMAVVTKVYDLVIWSCQHIAKFPRSQRFTLGDRLEMRLFDVLEKLIRTSPAATGHSGFSSRSRDSSVRLPIATASSTMPCAA